MDTTDLSPEVSPRSDNEDDLPKPRSPASTTFAVDSTLQREEGSFHQTPTSPSSANQSLPQQGAILTPSHAFGIQGELRDCLTHVDSTHIIYPVGRHVVVASLETREMTFLTEQQRDVKYISAVTSTSNKKHYAVAEKLRREPHSQITLYNLTTMKKINSISHPEAREIHSLSFSGDGRYLAAQTGKPEWSLLYFQWEKGILVASAKVAHSVTRMTFNPWDNSQLATSGRKFLKIWRLVEGQLQGFHANIKKETQNYTDHLWLMGDLLIVSTDTGDVLVFEQGELRKTFPSIHPHKHGITALEAFSKGFIAAGSGGYVSFFERTTDIKEYFTLVKTVYTGHDGYITSMSTSPSEEVLLCATTRNQMISFSIDLERKVEAPIHDLSNHIHAATFHSGQLLGLDVCVRKPLVATCGTDRMVAVWNYLTRSAELSKRFDEEPSSIAIHPTGDMVAVGFASALRILNVLVDGLAVEHEWSNVKGCKEVRFSNGGHLLAAALGSTVQLYSTVTFEPVNTLRGHQALVKALCWAPDDRRLVSCSIDGAVIEWSLATFEPVEENTIKTSQYNDVAYNGLGSAVFACEVEPVLRQLSSGTVVKKVPTGAEGLVRLAIPRNNRVVFAATSSGIVKLFPLPLGGTEPSAEQSTQPGAVVMEYAPHAGGITRLVVSPDDTLVFTAAEDGALFVYSVTYVEGGKAIVRKPPEPPRYYQYVLAARSWLDERASVIGELQNKLSELQSRAAYELHLKERQHEEAVAKMKAEFEARHTEELSRYNELQKMKIEQELKAKDLVAALEKEHLKAAEELEELYEKKLAEQNAKLQDLAREKYDMEFRFEEERRQLKAETAKQIDALKAAHEARLKEEADKYSALRKELELLQAVHEEELEQNEEEFEFQMAQMQEKAAKILQIERDNTMSLMGDNAILKRKWELFNLEFEKLQKAAAEKDKDITKLRRKQAELEETIELLRKEVEERNETIGQKENTIFELKQKNQELEKFRFVLDYKISELKEELEPKELMIGDMARQIKAMDEELQKTLKNADQLELALNEKNLKLDYYARETKKLKELVSEKEKIIRRFVEDLHKLYTGKDAKQWRDGMKQLYHAYVTQDSKRRITKEDTERMQELARQRQYMERSLNILKQKALRGEERMKLDVQKKVAENENLIAELNYLRRKNKELQSRIVLLENEAKAAATKAASRVRQSLQQDVRSIEDFAEMAGRQAARLSPTSSPQHGHIDRARMEEMITQIDENNKLMEAQDRRLRELQKITASSTGNAAADGGNGKSVGGRAVAIAHLRDDIDLLLTSGSDSDSGPEVPTRASWSATAGSGGNDEEQTIPEHRPPRHGALPPIPSTPPPPQSPPNRSPHKPVLPEIRTHSPE